MLDLIPEHTIYPINYVAMGLEFQCMCVCVCVGRRRSHGEKGSVYTVTHSHTEG